MELNQPGVAAALREMSANPLRDERLSDSGRPIEDELLLLREQIEDVLLKLPLGEMQVVGEFRCGLDPVGVYRDRRVGILGATKVLGHRLSLLEGKQPVIAVFLCLPWIGIAQEVPDGGRQSRAWSPAALPAEFRASRAADTTSADWIDLLRTLPSLSSATWRAGSS